MPRHTKIHPEPAVIQFPFFSEEVNLNLEGLYPKPLERPVRTFSLFDSVANLCCSHHEGFDRRVSHPNISHYYVDYSLSGV